MHRTTSKRNVTIASSGWIDKGESIASSEGDRAVVQVDVVSGAFDKSWADLKMRYHKISLLYSKGSKVYNSDRLRRKVEIRMTTLEAWKFWPDGQVGPPPLYFRGQR